MKSKVNFSIVQMRVLSAKSNLPKILHYIKKAAKNKSDIIGFPECVFNPKIKKPYSEKDLAVIKRECRLNNIYVIINGYFKAGQNVFNRTYIINNKGRAIGYYDKIYLWTTELGKVKRGGRIKVFDTPLGKIGLCTCWDLFFPEMINKLKDKGAEIIFCPSYWNDKLKKESRFLECVSTVYAYDFMVFFVYCNSLLKGMTSVSQIASPWGELKDIKYKEGIIDANFYADKLERFKSHFKSVLFGKKI